VILRLGLCEGDVLQKLLLEERQLIEVLLPEYLVVYESVEVLLELSFFVGEGRSAFGGCRACAS